MKTARNVVAALAAAAMLALGLTTIPIASAAGDVTIAPIADTYVQADRPTENFGTSVRWSAEGRANIWRNSLLKFDVPVPAGEEITSVKLRAYSEAATTATEFVDVYTVSDAWTETGVTWNNAPARGTWLGKQGNFATGAWVEWDVTAGVAATGGLTNFKLETNAQKWVGFKSKEVTDPALRPQLVVTTVASATPTPTPTPTTPPAADWQPKNVRVDPAVPITDTSFRAIWDAVPNYTGQYKHYLNGEIVWGADDTTTAESFTGLTPGTTYSLEVGATVDGVLYKSTPISVTTTGSTTPTPTPTPTPTTPPATGDDWDLAVVGDMNGERTTSSTSASGKNASSIKAALDSGAVDNFFGVGDFQYSTGTCDTAANGYFGFWDGLWGGTKSKLYWNAAPNHDYQPGRNTDFDNWMNGECVNTVKAATNTDPTRKNRNTQNGQPAGFQDAQEWYSVDRGNWHMLSASSAPWRYDTALANRQTAEIDRDLAEAKAAGKHLVVMLHEPYFGSATSSHQRELSQKPWIDVFYKHGVKILLSGSQHNYERTCPVNPSAVCDEAKGMVMFQVSTGGIGLRAFSDSPAHSAARFTGTWGWLKMSLKADGSYTWDYQPTSGTMTNDDNGSRQ